MYEINARRFKGALLQLLVYPGVQRAIATIRNPSKGKPDWIATMVCCRDTAIDEISEPLVFAFVVGKHAAKPSEVSRVGDVRAIALMATTQSRLAGAPWVKGCGVLSLLGFRRVSVPVK